MPRPFIPPSVHKYFQDNKGAFSTFPFPPNIAGAFPPEHAHIEPQIWQWMFTKYVWPQIIERQPFERQWRKLLNMARATYEVVDLGLSENELLALQLKWKALESGVNANEEIELGDTLIFDAIDRLGNLAHFISFKEKLPFQFIRPPFAEYPEDTPVYSPSTQMVKAANSWAHFCANGADFYRKHWMTYRHNVTYGCSFIMSDYRQWVEPVIRRDPINKGKTIEQLELCDIGVGFDPISIRKLWLNYRIPAFEMESQPCPFWFEPVPRFKVQSNQYDPNLNPFGYNNLQNLGAGQWIFGDPASNSWLEALAKDLPDFNAAFNIGDPKYNLEAKWTFRPMLPLQLLQNERGEIDIIWDPDGTKGLPLRRWVVEMYGSSIFNGQAVMIRLQPDYYPKGLGPLYGSAHMPDLDSGTYSPAIGTILECHYRNIIKATNQFLNTKDLMNDPPVAILGSSPLQDKTKQREINKRGGRYTVNGPNDATRAEFTDNTATTPTFLEATRDQAKTSAKVVDAIVGKAMGARTSATEASNIFQTAMSGVTTDVNLFNADISGGFAERTWMYAGLWVDPDVIRDISGQSGFAIKPEHMAIRLAVKTDVGSTYMESITRQGNLRYMLEAGAGDPAINRAELWKMLLEEWKFPNPERIVNDMGFRQQVMRATEQAIMTYRGEFVMPSPDQNHELALQVKIAFLEDRNSVWNTTPEYVMNAPALVQQIQLHSMFLRLQQLQMQAAQEEAMAAEENNMLLQSQLRSSEKKQPNTGGDVAKQRGDKQ